MSHQSHQQALSRFYAHCAELADHIESQRSALYELLGGYETREVIDHEITSSLAALRNVRVEYDSFEHPVSSVTASCFMPVNMPLYSLVLYGVLPSYYYSAIYIRPGASLRLLGDLAAMLKLSELGFSKIHIKDLPAKLFTDLYAKDSDVILFTGAYKNALVLEKECPESLLIFEGTGPCPFFVFANGNAALAAEKAVAIRCFNGGQDCIAPDVFFVHQQQLDSFVHELKKHLQAVKLGSSHDPEVRIAQVIKEKYLVAVAKWLEKHRDYIVYGGTIDTSQQLIHPTIVLRAITEQDNDYIEFFSPVFNVVSYQDELELFDLLNGPYFRERSMYACLFGEHDAIMPHLKDCTVLRNITVNDQENGNQPYGGYGPLANFVSYKGVRKARPLLISRDIREWLQANQRREFTKQSFEIAKL